MKWFIQGAKNFSRHQGSDVAAGLTYYAVLAIFPALLALLSLLGVVGDPDKTVNTVLDVLRPLMSGGRLNSVEPVLHKLSHAQGAGLTLVIGVVAALYSASAYVAGFSRAMNKVREVEETRPFWKLKPLMLLITVVAVLLSAVALVIVTVSGPVASSISDKIGLDDSVLHIWNIAKWPGLAFVVVIIVAMLYHATPNVKFGRFRVLSSGAFIALLIWALASVGFAFYVVNFSSYNKTYGSIAGVVVLLLWLWLTNLALLFGAELDAVRDAQREARLEEAAPEEPLVAARSLHAPGMFPHKPGTPVYGPVPQPVPYED